MGARSRVDIVVVHFGQIWDYSVEEEISGNVHLTYSRGIGAKTITWEANFGVVFCGLAGLWVSTEIGNLTLSLQIPSRLSCR